VSNQSPRCLGAVSRGASLITYYRLSANAAETVYRVFRHRMSAQMCLRQRDYSRVVPLPRARRVNLRKGYPLDSNRAIHAP
jgi:hypothetical protein